MHFINKLYRARVKVARQSIPILNISLLFTLVAALISPHLLILSAILILLLGYRVSFDKDDADFAGADTGIYECRNSWRNKRSCFNRRS